MVVALGSFNRSPLGAFTRSPLGVRNRGHGCTGPDAAEVGACCLYRYGHDLCFSLMAEDQCDRLGGLFYGAGTVCWAPEVCPPHPEGQNCMGCCSTCTVPSGPQEGDTFARCYTTSHSPEFECRPPFHYCGTRERPFPQSRHPSTVFCGSACHCSVGGRFAGACCSLSDAGFSECHMLRVEDCALRGGRSTREMTDCVTAGCSSLGACCVQESNLCINNTGIGECQSDYGGEWMGDNIHCMRGVCPGACCISEHVCNENMTAHDCGAIGTWMGEFSTCADIL